MLCGKMMNDIENRSAVMRIWWKSKSKRVVINYLLILVVIGIIFYLNVFRLMMNVNTDYIVEMNYGKSICEAKSLFPADWVYANELMFFRPALLFSVCYALTGKYIFSYAMALCITFSFILMAFVYFVKGFLKDENNILMSILLFMSFCGNGRSFAVLTYLYYGYYGWYLVIVLLTVGYLERIYFHMKKNIWMLLIITVAACLLGLVGIRMTVFLYFPIMLTAAIHVLIEKGLHGILNINYIKISVFLLLINAMGFIIGKIYLRNINIYSNVLDDLCLVDLLTIPERIWQEIVSVISILAGNVSSCKIFSFVAIDMLLKSAFVVFVIFILLRNKYLFFNSPVVWYFICYFFIVIGISVFSSYGGGHAHFYFLVPLLIIYIASSYFEKKENAKRIVLLSSLVYAVFVSNFMAYYKEDIFIKANSEGTMQLVEWIKDHDIKKIATTFWTAGPIEAYSGGSIEVCYMTPIIDDIQGYIYLNNKDNYSMDDKDVIVVLTDEEEHENLNNINSKLNTRNTEKVGKIDGYLNP